MHSYLKEECATINECRSKLNSMDKEILIQKHLHGELSAEESSEFERLVNSDEEFRAELEVQSVYYADRSSALKKELQSYKPKVDKSPFRRGVLILLAAIGLFIVGYVANKFFFVDDKNDHIHMAQKFLSDKHDAPAVLMGEQTEEEIWMQSIDLYNKAKYKQAGISFLEASKTGKSDQALLYAALSYLYSDPNLQFMATPIFKSLIKKNSVYIEEAKWYLALIYIKEEEASKSQELLKEIINDKSWNHSKAQKLIDTEG